MTKIVRIQDNQVVTLTDFQNLSKFPRAMHDALVVTAVASGAAYAGAAVAKTATTEVTVSAPAYLYKNGALWTGATDSTAIDLLTVLPTAGNKRYVAILLQVQEQETDTQARDFEVDGSVYPPVMDPQPTATVTWRKANIAYQIGDQAPSPVKPVIDTANTVIAWVTLSSTQIDLVEQETSNRLNTLQDVDGRLKLVETWRDQTQPVIDGLRTDVARLGSAGVGKTDRRTMGYILEQLARVSELAGVADGASFSKTDYFLDKTDSDTEHINYVAKVEEGLRFADDNSDRSVLALETPGDTRIKVHGNGLMLPKSADQTILSVVGNDAEVAISNGGSQTIDYIEKTISRTVIRYGDSFTVCTNNQWWQTGRYDQATETFARAGETFEVLGSFRENTHNHLSYRLRKYWYDTVEDPYWEELVTTNSYTGNVSSNTFMMPRSAWVKQINLAFSRLDTGGDVRLVLCEVNSDGSPNYAKTLTSVTVAAADLNVYPKLTAFKVGPVFLVAGSRYAWAVITSGDHWLCMVEGNKYAQGSYFTSTDGIWSQGNISQDAAFEVIGALFETPRLVVNLNDWNLSGGVTDIALDLEQIVPEGTSITYEYQLDGIWHAVEPVLTGNSPLQGLPAAVNARVTLLGTTELMPALKVGGSYRTLSRPRTDSTHISKTRTAPANVDEVHVVAVLEDYVEANHDCTVSLLVGATLDTEVAASSSSDEVLPDGSIRRSWVFAGLTPTTDWKRKTVIATTSALSVFHVAEQTDFSFPAP